MSSLPVVTCPYCGHEGPISPEFLGKVVACPHCSRLFNVHAEPTVKQAKAPASKPTAPEPVKWYVLKDEGGQVGPFTMDVLKRLASTGHLRADAWVVMAGTDACLLAATLPELVFRMKQEEPRPRAPAPAAKKPAAPAARQPAAPRPAPKPAPAAPQKPATVTIDCPSCKSKCIIPPPQTPTLFTCPRCRRPFRAAGTSVGVVAKKVNSSLVTVHKGKSPDTGMKK